jgi:hypothetical protein
VKHIAMSMGTKTISLSIVKGRCCKKKKEKKKKRNEEIQFYVEHFVLRCRVSRK